MTQISNSHEVKSRSNHVSQLDGDVNVTNSLTKRSICVYLTTPAPARLLTLDVSIFELGSSLVTTRTFIITSFFDSMSISTNSHNVQLLARANSPVTVTVSQLSFHVFAARPRWCVHAPKRRRSVIRAARSPQITDPQTDDINAGDASLHNDLHDSRFLALRWLIRGRS